MADELYLMIAYVVLRQTDGFMVVQSIRGSWDGLDTNYELRIMAYHFHYCIIVFIL